MDEKNLDICVCLLIENYEEPQIRVSIDVRPATVLHPVRVYTKHGISPVVYKLPDFLRMPVVNMESYIYDMAALEEPIENLRKLHRKTAEIMPEYSPDSRISYFEHYAYIAAKNGSADTTRQTSSVSDRYTSEYKSMARCMDWTTEDYNLRLQCAQIPLSKINGIWFTMARFVPLFPLLPKIFTMSHEYFRQTGNNLDLHFTYPCIPNMKMHYTEYKKEFPADIYHKTFCASIARIATTAANQSFPIQIWIHNANEYLDTKTSSEECFTSKAIWQFSFAFKIRLVFQTLNQVANCEYMTTLGPRDCFYFREYQNAEQDSCGIYRTQDIDIYRYNAQHFYDMAKRELARDPTFAEIVQYINYSTGGMFIIPPQIECELQLLVDAANGPSEFNEEGFAEKEFAVGLNLKK